MIMRAAEQEQGEKLLPLKLRTKNLCWPPVLSA